MKKLCGAAVIMLASLLAAWMRVGAKRDRIRLLRSLSLSLLELRRELSERQRSLRESFLRLSEKDEDQRSASFYRELCAALRELGEQSFSELWARAIGNTVSPADDVAAEILLPLGGILGGSELDRQCAALDRAAQRLSEEAEARRDELRRTRPLNFGLPLSLGAFLVIMML